jgi:hypothetical protein
MMKTARPESVTVIGWMVLVFCGFGAMGCVMIWILQDMAAMQAFYTRSHISPGTYFTVMLAHLIIDTLCAVAFLLRQGWARYVFAVNGAVTLVYGWWISPLPLLVIPSVLYVAGVTAVLFLPANHRWFAGKDAAA